MKRDADWFGEREPELIYIAKKLRDAEALEIALTEADIDYGVEADEYQGGVVFRRTRIGAFFYVLEETREAAQAVMKAKGFRFVIPGSNHPQ